MRIAGPYVNERSSKPAVGSGEIEARLRVVGDQDFEAQVRPADRRAVAHDLGEPELFQRGLAQLREEVPRQSKLSTVRQRQVDARAIELDAFGDDRPRSWRRGRTIWVVGDERLSRGTQPLGDVLSVVSEGRALPFSSAAMYAGVKAVSGDLRLRHVAGVTRLPDLLTQLLWIRIGESGSHLALEEVTRRHLDPQLRPADRASKVSKRPLVEVGEAGL